MNKQQLYLKKIENDVNERIYDLLVQHLKEVHKILPKTDDNKDYLRELNKHLFKALDDLKHTNRFNYLQNYRSSILIINIILSYKPEESHLKQVKLSILNKFSSDIIYDKKEKIPLKSQMTELRITYDTSYLIYLLENIFIKKEMWDKAIYCLIAIELVEPDHEDIQKYKEIITKHLKKEELTYKEFEEPKENIILLDTNIVLNKVLYDVGEYKISHNKLEEYNSLMEKWGNNNKFVITNSIKEELEKQIKFSIDTVNNVCSKFKHFNKKEIITTLEKRFNNLIKKYAVAVEEKRYNLTNIEKFYSNYLGNLYEITLDKIENKKLSKKLKKLSDREGLLPELGDLKLLADAIELKKSNPNIAILSNDKDLYLFNEQIEKVFGIKIYK